MKQIVLLGQCVSIVCCVRLGPPNVRGACAATRQEMGGYKSHGKFALARPPALLCLFKRAPDVWRPGIAKSLQDSTSACLAFWCCLVLRARCLFPISSVLSASAAPSPSALPSASRCVFPTLASGLPHESEHERPVDRRAAAQRTLCHAHPEERHRDPVARIRLPRLHPTLPVL